MYVFEDPDKIAVYYCFHGADHNTITIVLI